MKEKTFRSKRDAELAAGEVMRHGYPAGAYGYGRKWRVEAHGYVADTAQRVRIHYMLGTDGQLHETRRAAV